MLTQEKAVDSTASPPDAETAWSDRDDAAKLVGEHAQVIDPDVGARVLRKIDWFLIPAMIVGTFSRSLSTHVQFSKSIRIWTCLLRQSDPWQCRTFRNDERSISLSNRHFDYTSNNQYVST
jgi:hypothetical protein